MRDFGCLLDGCLLVAAFWKMDWGTGFVNGVLWRKLWGMYMAILNYYDKLINYFLQRSCMP